MHADEATFLSSLRIKYYATLTTRKHFYANLTKNIKARTLATSVIKTFRCKLIASSDKLKLY